SATPTAFSSPLQTKCMIREISSSDWSRGKCTAEVGVRLAAATMHPEQLEECQVP
ncbi:unnamed protein product, partial [Amoebophrya sp. A120]